MGLVGICSNPINAQMAQNKEPFSSLAGPMGPHLQKEKINLTFFFRSCSLNKINLHKIRQFL